MRYLRFVARRTTGTVSTGKIHRTLWQSKINGIKASERRLEREYEACSTELRRQVMYEELTTSEWLALQLTANTTYFAQRRELSDRFYAQLRSL